MGLRGVLLRWLGLGDIWDTLSLQDALFRQALMDERGRVLTLIKRVKTLENRGVAPPDEDAAVADAPAASSPAAQGEPPPGEESAAGAQGAAPGGRVGPPTLRQGPAGIDFSQFLPQNPKGRGRGR